MKTTQNQSIPLTLEAFTESQSEFAKSFLRLNPRRTLFECPNPKTGKRCDYYVPIIGKVGVCYFHTLAQA